MFVLERCVYDNMAQNSQKSYNEIQVQTEIFRVSKHRDSQSQYRGSSIQKHTHNNLDSPPVNYSDLKNVRNYLASNSITLNQANVGLLHTVPFVLVKDPGIQSVIIVHSVTARLSYGSNQYTGSNNIEIRYKDGSGTKVTVDIPFAFVNSSSSAWAHAPAVTAEFTPAAGGGGVNGQIVAVMPTSNITLIGGSNLTTTSSISLGATSATLTGNWTSPSGKGPVQFSDGEIRQVTFTNGSAAISWTPALTGNVTSALIFGGFFYSPINLTIHYHVVSSAT